MNRVSVWPKFNVRSQLRLLDLPRITNQLTANWLTIANAVARESFDPSESKNNRQRCTSREPRRVWMLISNGEGDTKKCALPRVLKKSILDKKNIRPRNWNSRSEPLASRKPFFLETLFESLLHLFTETVLLRLGSNSVSWECLSFPFAFAFSCIFRARQREKEKDLPAEDNRNSFCFRGFNESFWFRRIRTRERRNDQAARGFNRQFESLNCLRGLHRN